MHVDVVPNRSSPPAILIRESFREDGKVRKRTRANLSGIITVEEAKQLKRILAGETLVPASEAFEVSNSKAHGHVLAVALAMKQLRMAELLHSRASRERDLVLALVAARIIHSGTKLATSRSWDDSTLALEFGVAGGYLVKYRGTIDGRAKNVRLVIDDGGGIQGETTQIFTY